MKHGATIAGSGQTATVTVSWLLPYHTLLICLPTYMVCCHEYKNSTSN